MENNETKVGFIARYAKIATVIAVIFGSSSGILGSLTAAPSMAIGFWRLTVALPFFLVPALLNSQKREQLRNIEKKDYLWCFIAGAFLFGHFFTWFNAVKLTNIASAAVLAALHPLVVLLITIFVYKKKVGFKSIGAIIVALIGGVIIVGVDYSTFAGGSLDGNVLAFLAGTFMGLYFAVGDSVRKRVPGDLYVLLVFASCWVCFSIGVVVTDTQILGYTVMDYVYIVIMAFICQIGAHAVFNMCIGHVSSLYVSTWEAGEPVFSTLLAVVFLAQIPKSYEIIGCVIVVCALLYYNRQESKHE
ncbi:MAG: DMT family transporter [Firmicutes bacterium]|nr:DMT family transporter [Bacillota bacterium]